MWIVHSQLMTAMLPCKNTTSANIQWWFHSTGSCAMTQQCRSGTQHFFWKTYTRTFETRTINLALGEQRQRMGTGNCIYAYNPTNRQASRGRQTLDIRKHSYGHIRMEAQLFAGAQTVPATHAMLKLVGPFANVQFCYSVRLFNVYVLFLRARSIS